MKAPRRMKPLLLTLLVLSPAAILSGEEPAAGRNLPEPGTWLKYFLEDVRPEGEQTIANEEMTFKVLAEETYDGEPFVRIEMVTEPVHKRHVSKVLLVIRKQALREGNLRKQDVKLLESKLATLPVRDDTAEVSDPIEWAEVVVPALLYGGLSDWKDARVSESETPIRVDWQQGRSESRQKVTLQRALPMRVADERSRVLLINYVFPDAPNGVLRAIVRQEESHLDPQSNTWSDYSLTGAYHLTLMGCGTGVEATLKE